LFSGAIAEELKNLKNHVGRKGKWPQKRRGASPKRRKKNKKKARKEEKKSQSERQCPIGGWWNLFLQNNRDLFCSLDTEGETVEGYEGKKEG